MLAESSFARGGFEPPSHTPTPRGVGAAEAAFGRASLERTSPTLAAGPRRGRHVAQVPAAVAHSASRETGAPWYSTLIRIIRVAQGGIQPPLRTPTPRGVGVISQEATVAHPAPTTARGRCPPLLLHSFLFVSRNQSLLSLPPIHLVSTPFPVDSRRAKCSHGLFCFQAFHAFSCPVNFHSYGAESFLIVFLARASIKRASRTPLPRGSGAGASIARSDPTRARSRSIHRVSAPPGMASSSLPGADRTLTTE